MCRGGRGGHGRRGDRASWACKGFFPDGRYQVLTGSPHTSEATIPARTPVRGTGPARSHTGTTRPGRTGQTGHPPAALLPPISRHAEAVRVREAQARCPLVLPPSGLLPRATTVCAHSRKFSRAFPACAPRRGEGSSRWGSPQPSCRAGPRLPDFLPREKPGSCESDLRPAMGKNGRLLCKMECAVFSLVSSTLISFLFF